MFILLLVDGCSTDDQNRCNVTIADCVSGLRSYDCQCKAPFTGDGITCLCMLGFITSFTLSLNFSFKQQL